MVILKSDCLNKTYVSSKSTGFFKEQKTNFEVLKDFSLTIEKPGIYGLVGPNGAGKTTFIRHCLGLVEKTSGVLEVLGQDPFLARKSFLSQISLISGNHDTFESKLSSRELLKFQAALYNLNPLEAEKRSFELVDFFKIRDKIDIPLERLSLGQKMKFEIISKLLHKPKLLFLDEPTLGLDFEAQSMMHSLLLDLHQNEQVTIFLTSHYLADITTLCSKFTVIEEGKNVFTGDFKQLNSLTSSHKGYLKSLIKELNKN